MPHAVVFRVKLSTDEADQGEGLRILREQVVPHAKSQPGFQSGTWMNHAGDGMGIVIFDSEQNAEAARHELRPPADGPELVSAEVYEVGAQA